MIAFILRIKWFICLNFITIATSTSPSLELIRCISHDADAGTVCLQCRDTFRNFVNVTDVIFWHNRRSATDPGLRERDDVTTFETEDQLGIVFNLTQQWEGFYTCGRRIDSANVYESRPKPLISFTAHRHTIPLPDMMETTSIATAGSRARLQCPIRPSALAQYYAVRWTKGADVVGELLNSSTPYNMAPRHSIDMNDFSLIIENVRISDAASYRCFVIVRDPLSYREQTRIPLRTDPEVSLSLQVKAPPVIYLGPASIKATSTEETLSFNCTATGLPSPSITWTFVAANGTAASLAHSSDSTDYKIESGIAAAENELSMIHSTLTFVRVAPNTIGKVVCKALQPGIKEDETTAVTAEALISVLGGSVENEVDSEDVADSSESVSIQLGQLGVGVVVAILVILVVVISVLTLCISVTHGHRKSVSKDLV